MSAAPDAQESAYSFANVAVHLRMSAGLKCLYLYKGFASFPSTTLVAYLSLSLSADLENSTKEAGRERALTGTPADLSRLTSARLKSLESL